MEIWDLRKSPCMKKESSEVSQNRSRIHQISQSGCGDDWLQSSGYRFLLEKKSSDCITRRYKRESANGTKLLSSTNAKLIRTEKYVLSLCYYFWDVRMRTTFL
jgi:hypothetical protein